MIRREVVIGNARLILGDCRLALSDVGKFDAVVTDPPFGMSFRSNFRNEQHSKISGDYDDSLLIWATNLVAYHSKYIFCRWDNLLNVPKPKSLITWVKNNWSMGDLDHEHARQTETILFYPGINHSFPRGRPQDVIKAPKTGNNFHPTEKPVGLMQAIVEWTDGVVFDPFMGSGSTGVACSRLGRPFVGIEIVPDYFDIACDRISTAHNQHEMFACPNKEYFKHAENSDLFLDDVGVA